MARDGCNYFSFWAIFCPFTALTARKIKIKTKIKKKPGDIIILHKQGSTNCAHGDERGHNVHVKSFSRARSYVHVN